ncbi:MAG: hypothetical protein EP343_02805 [Deltaproteobacteria bacterium]|nr:MAG: hypothetical protein EP343_02805 [Deltaproteobacteria bacterium]
MNILLVPITMIIIFGGLVGLGASKGKTYTHFFGWITKEEKPTQFWIAMVLYGACLLISIGLLVFFTTFSGVKQP